MRSRTPTESDPEFGLYLLGHRPVPTCWPSQWIPWPDFRPPRDPSAASAAIRDVWERAATERVEVACGGGRGRTGTALACMAVLDGLDGVASIAYVRGKYHHRAVETPGQLRYVMRFPVARQ